MSNIDNLEYKFLYDVNNEKDWQFPLEQREEDGSLWESARTIHHATGPEGRFRCTDSVFYPQPNFHLHKHRSVYEVFFWTGAPFNLYINGKKTVVDPGSVTLFRPDEPHGFEFSAPSRKVGFFWGMQIHAEDAEAGAMLRRVRPDARKSPDFPIVGLMLPDITYCEPPVDPQVLPPEQVLNVKHIDRPADVFEYDGVTMKMIVPRWELGSLSEVWAAEMKKGFYAKSEKYPMMPQMYYVTEGEVKFKIYDEEFVAHKECVVKVPKYAEFSMEALTYAVVYDVGGVTEWFNYLQSVKSIKALDPDRYNDSEAMKALRASYKCQIREFGMK